MGVSSKDGEVDLERFIYGLSIELGRKVKNRGAAKSVFLGSKKKREFTVVNKLFSVSVN